MKNKINLDLNRPSGKQNNTLTEKPQSETSLNSDNTKTQSRMAIYLTKDLHRKLKLKAVNEDRSVNSIVLEAINLIFRVENGK